MSFGHGLVVASVAVILGMFVKNFKFPDSFNTLVTWVSIVSLFLIGTLNIYNLLRVRLQEGEFQLRGIKGRLIPRIAQETTHPLLVVLVGAIFALAADTVSQTSVWAIAAGNAGGYMPFVLALIFMIGMMMTDTIDSLITYRMINQTDRMGQSASRAMGWGIVFLAYGVSFYEAFTFFNPWAELNFEVVGVIVFVLLILCCLLTTVQATARKQAVN